MAVTVSRLSGAIGAEISGVDLSGEISGEDIVAIRRVWLEHLVVFFRDQPLGLEQFVAFGRRFGQLVAYPLVPAIPGYPEVIEVLKLAHERSNFGGIWHSDTAYLEQPPMATMLLAREIPPVGGDTLFANGYLAYESLSPGLRQLLDPLEAVNSSALADVSRTREDRLAGSGAPERVFEASHRVVRIHPETGRRSLYVNGAHTDRFADMSTEESHPLLAYLFEHQIRPEFTCRFRWEVGSLAMWDNRCALHNPINDYHGYRRSMHRISLADDPVQYLKLTP